MSRNFEAIFVGIDLTIKFYNWKPRIPVLIAILLLVISNGVLASTSTVQLSEDEKRWLSEHPSIRLAVDIDWSPFENINDENQYVGMAAEYIALVGQKLAEELSITDELTSLFNRRHFNNLFPQELACAEREKKTIVLMIIDVDYFKPYNDNYGHQQGDNALRAVSGVLKNTLRRAGDFTFRIGGEEFGVIVTVDDSDAAYAIAEKLRKAVEDLGLEHAYSEVAACLTISIGMEIHQCNDSQPADMDLIYRLADDALYQAKENGRNQVASSCMDDWQATINE